MNWSGAAGCDDTPDTVTMTSTVPGEPAGAVTEIEVAVEEITVAATPPNFTVTPLVANPVPVIVTAVPAAVFP